MGGQNELMNKQGKKKEVKGKTFVKTYRKYIIHLNEEQYHHLK